MLIEKKWVKKISTLVNCDYDGIFEILCDSKNHETILNHVRTIIERLKKTPEQRKLAQFFNSFWCFQRNTHQIGDKFCLFPDGNIAEYFLSLESLKIYDPVFLASGLVHPDFDREKLDNKYLMNSKKSTVKKHWEAFENKVFSHEFWHEIDLETSIKEIHSKTK